MRSALQHWLERPEVRNAIIGVIIFNALLLGLETSETVMARFGTLIRVLDGACLAIFVVELGLKMVAYGRNFPRSGWRVFDFVIVGVSIMPGAQSLSVLRALRILRVLRVISVAPRLRRVVEGFLAALPGMGSVFLLTGLIFYIGSVMATNMFAETFPQWFGSLGRSGYSLFQIMTLESWSMGMVRPIMEVHPWAWAFFVPFILITTFAVVNLVVGLIVNSMQDAHHEEDNARTDAYRDEVMARLDAIDMKLDRASAPHRGDTSGTRGATGSAGSGTADTIVDS